MLWLNFLHFYQPANLEKEKISEAVVKSYEHILKMLEANSSLRVTVNFTGGLLHRLATDLARQDLIDGYSRLIATGQVEIVGTAAYHALLPLISKREMVAQIKEQEQYLKKYFGINRPRGFFLPELAYSAEVAKIVKKLGYEWLIVDEISLNGTIDGVFGGVCLDENSGLKVVARNRKISESYVPDTLLKIINDTSGAPNCIITATDAELYGLRHVDTNGELENLIAAQNFQTGTLSEYINEQSDVKSVKLIDSNWQTTEADLLAGQKYKLWSEVGNETHNDLWKLAQLAEKLHYKYAQDENIWWSRWHLSRGLQSCAWWWASRHDFREVFGPLAWSPDEVERGVNELIRSIRSLEKSTDLKTKIKAEKMAQKIRTQVWLKHWQ